MDLVLKNECDFQRAVSAPSGGAIRPVPRTGGVQGTRDLKGNQADGPCRKASCPSFLERKGSLLSLSAKNNLERLIV